MIWSQGTKSVTCPAICLIFFFSFSNKQTVQLLFRWRSLCDTRHRAQTGWRWRRRCRVERPERAATGRLLTSPPWSQRLLYLETQSAAQACRTNMHHYTHTHTLGYGVLKIWCLHWPRTVFLDYTSTQALNLKNILKKKNIILEKFH